MTVERVTTSDATGRVGEYAGLASGTYAALCSGREPFLRRARQNAELTLPKLFPAQGTTGATDQPVPWSTLGAYLVNNLGAKVLLSMFPPGRSPMRLKQSRAGARDLTAIIAQDEDQGGKLLAQIEQGLAKVENEFSDCVEEDGDRAHLAVLVLKLLVGGQHALQYYPQDGTLRGISLDKHVTKRDPQGNVLRFVIEDGLAWETLDEDVRMVCLRKGYQYDPTSSMQPAINVYTMGRRLAGNRWDVFQEVYGEEVPGTRRTYDDAALNYQFMPWALLPGEDYARSYVEDYLGDLQTLEGGEQTIAEGSAAMARFLQFVNPTGMTDKRAVEQAANGSVLAGRAEDITTMMADKTRDFQAMDNRINIISQRLARAFLVFGAQVRQAERVTTEEIVQVRRELEEILGGVYSLQVVATQLPYVKRKTDLLQKLNRITPLPKGSVSFEIIGGTAALGRHSELSAMDEWIMGGIQVLGPDFVREAVDPRIYMQHRAALLNLYKPGLVRSEEAMQAQSQNAMMASLVSKLGPAAINQAGQNLTANQVADTKAATDLQTADIASQPKGA